MKILIQCFLFTLVLVIGFEPIAGPDPVRCGRPSAIADLICYLNNVASGLNFALIGFSNRIAAHVSYYYDCQPAKRAKFRVLDVYGYIVNLTYANPKTKKKEFKVFYISLSVPGCPQFQELTNPPFNFSSFNEALLQSPNPADFAYFRSVINVMIGCAAVYRALYEDYDLACNVITSVPGGRCCPNDYGSSYSGCPYSKTPYYFEEPLTVADFENLKNAVIFQVVSENSNTSAGQDVIDTFGVYASCDVIPRASPDSYNELDQELCKENEYDNQPYCNRYDDKNTLAKILESYGYYNVSKLDANKACTISTLFAQGFYNPDSKKNDYRTCNCDAFTKPFSIAIFVDTGSQDYGAAGILIKGYCDEKFQKDVMSKFSTIC